MAEHDEFIEHRLLVRQQSRPWIARRGARGRRRTGFRRAGFFAFAFCSSLVFLAAIGGGLFFLRLTEGPIDVGLGDRIVQVLGDRVGHAYAFSIGSTVVEKSDNGPRLTIRQFDVKDHNGRVILAAPSAGLSVDPFALAVGKVAPKRLEIEDIVLRIIRRPDGKLAMSAGTQASADVPLAGSFTGVAEHAPTPGQAGRGAAGRDTPGAGQAVTRSLESLVNNLVGVMFDPNSPFLALDRFGIARGTLVVDDQLRNTSMTYKNFEVEFDREAKDGIYIGAGADGPDGHWSMSARINRTPDGAKLVDITADHLSMDEMLLAGGLRSVPMETDMPLSVNLGFKVAPGGKLAKAEGMVNFGAGYFRLDDPDHEPAMVDSIVAPLRIDPDTGEISVEKGRLVAGGTSFDFAIHAKPGTAPGDPWRLSGLASGIFGTERPGEQPIPLSKVDIGAEVYTDLDKVVLDHFKVNGPEVSFRADAVWQGNPGGKGFLVTSSMDVGRMPTSNVLRLWPNWMASPPRAWLLANMHGGTLDYGHGRFAITDADIDTMRRQRSIPDSHSHIEFGITGTSLDFMSGVPAMKDLDGTGVITGDTVNIKINKGDMEVSPGHVLSLSNGLFQIPSMDPKPSPTVVSMHVTGKIETVAELLGRDALKPYANLPIDSSSVRGDVDGQLNVNMLLGDHAPPDSTKVGVDATVDNFFADKVIGKEPLQDATLAIVADKNGIHAQGEGRMFGAPASIDLKKPSGGAPSEALVSISLDDAARAKAGLTLGKSLTGPVAIKIATSLTSGDKSKANLDIDFTKAAFNDLLPGLKKTAGRPAKATCTIIQGGNETALDQIVFESGSTSIRGSAVLDAGGGFRSAKLSQLRLSPGDEMRVDAEQSADTLKLVVRGSNIDARPFLKALTTGDSAAESTSGGKNLDIDLHANLLTGPNSQALTNTELRVQRRNGQFRRVQMTGRLGRGPITINTVAQGQTPTLVVAARDAGAVMSFLDLYKRMDGGRLDASLTFDGNRLDGHAAIHDFTIKEDPAIKKLAQEEIPSSSRNAGAHITSSAVPFTKLEASFSRANNKVEIKDGSMFGPQMGATVEGSVDFARDRVALRGTFVPIYGLNNLFSQIPVVGMLLGGGAHEGLFAVNYRIDGPATAPVMSFDPLSALAPGFLRKIFGAIDNAAQGNDTGASAAPDSVGSLGHGHSDGLDPGSLFSPD